MRLKIIMLGKGAYLIAYSLSKMRFISCSLLAAGYVLILASILSRLSDICSTAAQYLYKAVEMMFRDSFSI